MVALALADRPDVLCLQEVPAWALPRLRGWSGMHAAVELAARPSLGPLPVPAAVGRLLTAPDHGRLRSAFAGQGNAILADPGLELRDRASIVLNPRGFRRRRASELGLGTLARLAWARERRVCQAVRLSLPGGGTLVLASLHASSFPADARVPGAELERAAAFLDAVAQPGEPAVLAGDLNAAPGSPGLVTLDARGYEGAGEGIDHVLVRGLPAEPAERWSEERRRREGRLLSDHAPVERRIG